MGRHHKAEPHLGIIETFILLFDVRLHEADLSFVPNNNNFKL